VGEVGGEDGGKQLDHGVFQLWEARLRRQSLTGQVYQRGWFGVCRPPVDDRRPPFSQDEYQVCSGSPLNRPMSRCLVTGHDFSRAAKAQKRMWALAPAKPFGSYNRRPRWSARSPEQA
jgi:hypothetical protein